MDGPSPINLSLITDKTLGIIAGALGFDLSQVQPEEFRTGIVAELENMAVHTSAGLNNDKLAQAATAAWENLQTHPTFYSAPPQQDFAHPLASNQGYKDSNKYEALERYIDHVIAEDFAGAVSKLKAAPAKIWAAAKAKLGQSSSLFKGLLNKSMKKLEAGVTKLKPIIALIKQAEAETGTQLPTNDMIKTAQSIPAEAKAAQAEIAAQQAAVSKLPPAQPAQQAECARQLDQIMVEAIEAPVPKYRLDEALTPMVVIGFVLALIGGIPMLINGLHKLATKMQLTKTASMLARIHHVAHNFEHKAIDYIVPDVLSYVIYTKFWKAGIKVRGSRAMEKPLSREEYSSGVDHVRETVEGIIYKIMLVWFLMQGVRGAYSAGVSILGLAEGAASSVKAVEIAAVVTQVAEILGPDALETAIGDS